jgi:hypothetical protein
MITAYDLPFDFTELSVNYVRQSKALIEAKRKIAVLEEQNRNLKIENQLLSYGNIGKLARDL